MQQLNKGTGMTETPSGGWRSPGDVERDVGGEPACRLDEVCEACGGLDDGLPRAVCSRCGAPRSGDGHVADR